MAAVKAILSRLLEEGRYERLPELAREDGATVRKLFALLYDREPLLRWRSVLGFGVLARHQPESVQRTISRLAYALNDEASICGWMSAPAIGEMTAHNPALTERVVRIVVHYITDVETCHGVNRNVEILCSALWAIGRIATTRPELLSEVGKTVVGFMTDASPEVRAHAYWCAGHSGSGRLLAEIPHPMEDETRAAVFDPESGVFREEPVSFFARMALSNLPGKPGGIGGKSVLVNSDGR